MGLRESYLQRALDRLRTGATRRSREQLLGARISELQFRLRSGRRAALQDLPAPGDGHASFRFALEQFPGGLFFPSGPAQHEAEILAMLAFAAERDPRTVVEIGTSTGGTTFLLSAMLPSVTCLIGLDILVRNQARLRAFVRDDLDLHLISGSSRDAGTLRAVTEALRGRPIDLLFIDGDHSFSGAAEDFRTFRRLVRPGGLIAFHDIVPDATLRSGAESLTWAGEVPVLWEILRSQYPSHEFVDSFDQEAFGIGVLEHLPDVEPRFVPVRPSSSGR
jgi:predicted O-methyltransferase YrrM